ncbi:MAG: hypothetical protein MUE36_14675 [Acidimicrobiales bacterium]|jgi:hypothetical protein|nr:hypothetical protein [Acidimicrobiales bacterium]
MLATVQTFAGLAWDPGIRGILIVAVAVAVLMGSVYLLLATNVGARLGMLVALTGLFGFMVILTLIWWLQPPAIGPRGDANTWEPVEVFVEGGEAPRTAQAAELPVPSDIPSPEQILADNPQLAEEYPNGFVLSDLAANNPEILEQYASQEALAGWRVIPSSEAGEAQATADVVLAEAGIFGGPTEYKKLNVFSYGGKPTRDEECPDGGLLCRAWYRVRTPFMTNPEHYAVVQVQAVVEQTPVPGEAPPLPKVDESQPVISVVLVRELGTVRLIPFLYFVISTALFVLFAWVLHNRDKTLMKNKAAAEAVAQGT